MNKKFLAFLVLVSMLFSNQISSAQNNATMIPVQATKSFFQTSLETEINNAIVQIYGENFAPQIYDRVMSLAKDAIDNRSEELKKEDLIRTDDWYKDAYILSSTKVLEIISVVHKTKQRRFH